MNMQELKKLIYQGEKVDIECKKADNSVPKSAYESYSVFANTKGGYIILGVREDKTKTEPKERFIIQRIENAPKQKEDFWNTINGNKVNVNLLKDEDVEIVNEGSISLLIYRGGNSKSRNPHMQTMLRLVGFGDNAGSGFPAILDVWKSEGWIRPELIEDTNLDQVTLVMKMERESDENVIENVVENVIEISEEKIKLLMPEYSKKKLTKACEILKMISEKPNISIDELRIALDVTDRTIAKYISELKNKGIIERIGPDNGGEWKIKQVNDIEFGTQSGT